MHWWRSVQFTQERVGRPKITRRRDMKMELHKRYVPTTYKQDLAKRIASLTQEDKSMAKYSDEFHTLSNRAEIDEPKYIIVGKYKRGFIKPIRDILRLYTINTIAEAFQVATKAESIIASNTTLPLQTFTKSSSVPKVKPVIAPTTTTVLGLIVCWNCKEPGHSRANCSKPKAVLIANEDDVPKEFEDALDEMKTKEAEVCGLDMSHMKGYKHLPNLTNVNVTVGEKEERMMITGLHTVGDIFCVGCGSIVGWKYFYAHEKVQKYKEGKFILERFKVSGPDGHSYWVNHDPQVGGSDADDA